MRRGVALGTGELYHIYNRGAHKQEVFLDDRDYKRFQVLLLLTNGRESVDVGNILTKYQGPSLVNLFANEGQREKLVDILAYALMPNHYHLIVRQREENGISRFMRKIGTGYSMYFNLRYSHTGTVFQGRFKSSHIATDPYLFWVSIYVHLNPVSLIFPEWKEGNLTDLVRTKEFLAHYPYSSYIDYYSNTRPERSVIAFEAARHFIDTRKDLEALLKGFYRKRRRYKPEITKDGPW